MTGSRHSSLSETTQHRIASIQRIYDAFDVLSFENVFLSDPCSMFLFELFPLFEIRDAIKLGLLCKHSITVLNNFPLRLDRVRKSRYLSLFELEKYFGAYPERKIMWDINGIKLGPPTFTDLEDIFVLNRTILNPARLQYINFSLGGDIIDISALSLCINLEEFQFDGSVMDIQPLRYCQKLTHLHIQSSYYATDFSGIEYLTVEVLKIRSCLCFESLEPLSKCVRLKELSLQDCPSVEDIAILDQSISLKRMSITNCNVVDIPNLPTSLKRLSFSKCSSLDHISGIKNGLRELSIEACESLTDISLISHWTHIRTLKLKSCRSILLPPWSVQENQLLVVNDDGIVHTGTYYRDPSQSTWMVKQLILDDCRSLVSLDGIEHCTSVKVIRLDRLGTKNFDLLSTIGKSLRELSASYSVIAQIEFLEQCSHLKELNLGYCSSISDFNPIEKLSQLKKLRLLNCNKMLSIKFLKGNPRLVMLDIRFSKIAHLDGIENCKKLQKLYMGHCEKVNCLQPLSALQYLSELHAPWCSADNVTPLTYCKRLKEIDLSWSKKISNLQEFTCMPELKRLNIKYSHNYDVPEELLLLHRQGKLKLFW